MSKAPSILLTTLFLITLLVFSSSGFAVETLPSSLSQTRPDVTKKPVAIPSPPQLNAKAYILIDVNSGKIIAEKNSEKKLPPASLTKIMTLYVVSSALNNNQLKLSDTIRISKKAWKTGGSRMFVKEGDNVSVEDLLKGIIVDSGNDACVALSEYLGGSEEGFSDIMNQHAKALGMANSHFTDSTGLPDPKHYSTAKDLAILGRALVQDFPQYYHWYKQKWFTYNGIRQPNRNRLLWRDKQVDGIKTGHTNEAGYCLVSSAVQNNMRLLAVVLGSPSESARADDSQKLINYGFRFYETYKLYEKGQAVTELPLYKGTADSIKVGLSAEEYVTIPTGEYKNLSIHSKVPSYLKAPINKGDQIGELIIQLNDTHIDSKPLYALDSVEKGGFFKRMKDSVSLTLKGWIG